MLDEFVKNDLRCKYYIRYMDDFVILSDSVEELKEVWSRLEEFLKDRLKLVLNPKTTIVCAKNGVDFVGYRHYNRTRKVRKGAMRRMRKLLKEFKAGKIGKEQFEQSFQSRVASMEHADTYHLIQGYKVEANRLLKTA